MPPAHYWFNKTKQHTETAPNAPNARLQDLPRHPRLDLYTIKNICMSHISLSCLIFHDVFHFHSLYSFIFFLVVIRIFRDPSSRTFCGYLGSRAITSCCHTEASTASQSWPSFWVMTHWSRASGGRRMNFYCSEKHDKTNRFDTNRFVLSCFHKTVCFVMFSQKHVLFLSCFSEQ
jgi:hypothetical protein